MMSLWAYIWSHYNFNNLKRKRLFEFLMTKIFAAKRKSTVMLSVFIFKYPYGYENIGFIFNMLRGAQIFVEGAKVLHVKKLVEHILFIRMRTDEGESLTKWFMRCENHFLEYL